MMAGFLVAVLLTSISMGIAKKTATVKDELPLDMAWDSVDDMYDHCMSQMEKEVKKTYLENEKNSNKNFKNAWEKAEDYFKWLKKKHSPSQVAVYAYTLEEPNLYRDFNNAVRTNKSEYRTTFKYHSLHFYLTQAIQELSFNKLNEVNPKCVTVYRRTNVYFRQDVLNKKIRFGSFTSTSQGHYLNAKIFGNKSCFKIWTCFGADISEYSSKRETEVLIPLYEVFKVTKIEKSSNKDPCDVVYEVKSTETVKSDLNCVLIPKKGMA